MAAVEGLLTPAREARFWSNVETTGSCWYWTGTKGRNGYGMFWAGNRRTAAHRTAYQLLVGPIPDGLQIDHLCRTRSCVNPDHLEPVTQAENIARGMSGIKNASKSTCPKGHAYDSTDTNGRRRCRECTRETSREWARKNRPSRTVRPRA